LNNRNKSVCKCMNINDVLNNCQVKDCAIISSHKQTIELANETLDFRLLPLINASTRVNAARFRPRSKIESTNRPCRFLRSAIIW